MSAKAQEASYKPVSGHSPVVSSQTPRLPPVARTPRKVKEYLELLDSNDKLDQYRGKWGLKGFGLTPEQARAKLDE